MDTQASLSIPQGQNLKVFHIITRLTESEEPKVLHPGDWVEGVALI